MSNMSIERIGQFMSNGNVESIIDRGRSIEQPNTPGLENEAASNGVKNFGQILSDQLNEVNETQLQADNAIKQLAAGKNKNIHETMLMLEKADSSYRLMMQVRNKIIDAYREVMRMSV